jgi:hypothetical protein
MAGGRPRTYNDQAVAEIAANLRRYIDETDIPILAEFAYQNHIPRTVFYDYPEFSTLAKELIDKKEAQLERKGLAGEINKAMAIFSLKQLGWSDRQQLEHSGGTEPVKIIYEVVSAD